MNATIVILAAALAAQPDSVPVAPAPTPKFKPAAPPPVPARPPESPATVANLKPLPGPTDRPAEWRGRVIFATERQVTKGWSKEWVEPPPVNGHDFKPIWHRMRVPGDPTVCMWHCGDPRCSGSAYTTDEFSYVAGRVRHDRHNCGWLSPPITDAFLGSDKPSAVGGVPGGAAKPLDSPAGGKP